ncbi:MAG: hypothetical protein OIF48_20000 [Silicimonas sp.]|nr:hypothetical protein [Silicimonas sp.]
MANSVSEKQVEDVLSSVRRLVSSELPRKPRLPLPEGPGALVLTDAQRVESAHAAPETKSHSLEARVAELEAALGEQAEDEFEPDGSEDQDQHRPNRIVYTRPPRAAGETSRRRSSQRLSQITLVDSTPETEEDTGPAEAAPQVPPFASHDSRVPPADNANDEVAEAPMAEDVPLEPRPKAEVHVFGDPDDVVRSFEARIAAGRPISEPMPPQAAAAEPEPEPDAAPEPETETEAAPAEEAANAAFDAALTEAVAASLPSAENTDQPEAAEAEPSAEADADRLDLPGFDPSIFSADTPDPEVSASVLLSTTESDLSASPHDTLTLDAPITVPEAAAPQPCAVPDPGAPHSDPAPAPAASEADQAEAALAALPDEEAMQLLVARMIRAELQGDLGERITRNVRKLVRQEIKRAMTSRDLS